MSETPKWYVIHTYSGYENKVASSIMKAVENRKLYDLITNVCCVVTRYFGGVLLGTGGLVRAYTKSAQLGLEAAGINQMSSYSVLLITCPYSLLGVVQNILPEHDCMTDDIEYAADVTLTVTLPEGGEEALAAALRDATSAAVDVEVMESRFMGRHLR